MKNKFLAIVFLSMFCVATPAYAIIDIVATAQSVLEKVKEIETKIQAIRKKIEDTYRRAAEGFNAASSCFANPKSCKLEALTALGKNLKREGVITGVRALAESGLDKGNLNETSSEKLEEGILEAYSYAKGSKKGIQKASDKRDEIQGAIADELAILFAKGMVARRMIKNEKEEEIYLSDIKENQSDILSAQNNLALVSQARLSRILELRAYMQGANATAELGRYTRNAESGE